MSFENVPFKIGSTWKAAGDLSSRQWRVMYQSAAETATTQTTAGAGGIGLLYNKPSAAGQPCSIVVGGVCPAEAGAAFAQNALLTNDSVGRLVTAAGNDKVIAQAVQAATGASEIVPVVVNPVGQSLASGQGKAIPSNVVTAAFGCAASNTWENEDLIALLNAQLVTDIETGRRVLLKGVMEVITDNAVAHQVYFGDGALATATAAKSMGMLTATAAGSYFSIPLELFTDASGQIKIQVDDKDHVTFKFHPRGFEYLDATAIS